MVGVDSYGGTTTSRRVGGRGQDARLAGREACIPNALEGEYKKALTKKRSKIESGFQMKRERGGLTLLMQTRFKCKRAKKKKKEGIKEK